MLMPCKYLDYSEDKYTDCTIATLPHNDEAGQPIRYWRRGETWLDRDAHGRPQNPEKVQFCGQGRGRINSILPCYNGEMHCYVKGGAA